MILVIGKSDDVTSITIQQKINARGGEAILWETSHFPAENRIELNPLESAQCFFQINPEGKRYHVDEIQAVFRRWAVDVSVPKDEADPQQRETVYWNVDSALNSFLYCLNCLQVNSPEAVLLHRYKTYQLKLMHENGIRVPKTLVTNNPEAVLGFFNQCQGQMIMKSVSGGIYTHQITEAQLDAENLSRLSNMPIKFQELIPGMDIRAYLVQDEIFAMEIHSQQLDYRLENYSLRVPIKLPPEIEDQCRKIAKLLGLVYTGIDLRRTPDGEYVFFEANPSPIFLFDEMVTDYPISDRIVKLLMSAERQ